MSTRLLITSEMPAWMLGLGTESDDDVEQATTGGTFECRI